MKEQTRRMKDRSEEMRRKKEDKGSADKKRKPCK
jgi:hypothetical protein